jgi:hypothetical protein
MTELPSFAPSTYRELLDGTFRFYRRHLKAVWWFSFLILTPLTFWFIEGYVETESTNTSMESTIDLILEGTIRLAIVYPLMLSAFAVPDGQELTLKGCFSRAFRQFGRVLAGSGFITLIQGFIFFLIMGCIGLPLYFLKQADAGGPSPDDMPFALNVSLFLTCIPGIFLYVRQAFIIPAIRAEGLGLRQAIRRSWELSRGTTFQSAGILVLLSVLAYPFITGLFALQDWRFFLGVSDPAWLWTGMDYLYITVVRASLEPLIPIFLILLYRNQRIKREGLDLAEKITAS